MPLKKYLLPGFFSIFIAFFCLETFLFFLLKNPSWTLSHPKLLLIARNLYESMDKKHIQYSPDCARYDPDLFYTLRPGECHIAEQEFEHDYRINSMGLRDDESSLEEPEIILLGDSFTMGWGVAQEETFAQLLEKTSGLKALNAGIASYGTAREMLLLKKLDFSRLKYLVLQYESNDISENDAFTQGGYCLPISSVEDYQETQESLQKDHFYFWGKYTGMTLPLLFPHLTLSQEPAPDLWDESTKDLALLFKSLNYLQTLPLPKDLKIIVLNLELDHRFIPFFRKIFVRFAQDPTLPLALRNLQVLDTQPLLRQEDHYYRLDDHMNKEGHRVIADALWKILRQDPALGQEKSEEIKKAL